MSLKLFLEFLFRLEPVAQSHSLRAAVREINVMGLLAELFQSGRRLGRFHGWGALMLFSRSMF